MITILDRLVKTNSEYAILIAQNMRKKRKTMHLTQKELSLRSGVAYASLRRFEETGNISLTSLIQLARVLDSLDDFEQLFSRKHYSSIEDVINEV